MTGHNWDLPSPYILKVSVSGEHLDRLQHVNNIEYLRWLEEVGWHHITDLGASWEVWKQAERAMATHVSHINYLAAAVAGDFLRVGTWLIKCDGLRAIRRFQIIRDSDGATLLRAEIQYVCIDIKTGQPRRMPPSMLKPHRKAIIWSESQLQALPLVE
ncbi:acyl-CoA thioesterase [Endozoicomonadaceae bacterium StTr2]